MRAIHADLAARFPGATLDLHPIYQHWEDEDLAGEWVRRRAREGHRRRRRAPTRRRATPRDPLAGAGCYSRPR